MPDKERTAALLEASREQGLLVGQGGLDGTVIRIGPSLLITADEIAEGLGKLGKACDQVGWYAFWPAQFLVVVLYVLVYDRSIVTGQDMTRFREILAKRRVEPRAGR